MAPSLSVAEIQSAFGSSEQPRSSPVAKSDVTRWASSTDLEVLGLLYRYLANAQYFQRVVPNMAREEFLSIATKYLGSCLNEDPEGIHAHNRHEAGWEIAAMFTGLWRQDEASHPECLHLKNWLADIIKAGNSDVQLCLVNATLEHLFEDEKIASFFKDWSSNPELARAYSDAMLWPQQGGTSPIGKSS